MSLPRPTYDVRIVRRDFQGQTDDDWHATITRMDGKQAIRISNYRWLIKRATRRKALDRLFARIDRHDAKMAEVKEFTV